MTTETSSGITADVRVLSTEPLPTPAALSESVPLSPTARDTVLSGRNQVQDILSG